jgi:DNA-3-methyladenine glycosylase
LAIDSALNGASVLADPFELSRSTSKSEILVGTRIGLTKGQERLRRFGEKGSSYLSRPFGT